MAVIDEALRLAEAEFRRILDEHPQAPNLRQIRFGPERYSRHETIRFDAEFENGGTWHWILHVRWTRDAMCELREYDITHHCMELWRHIRSAPSRRQLREVTIRYHEAMRLCTDGAHANALRDQYQSIQEELRRQMAGQISRAFGLGPQHLEDRASYRADFARGPDRTAIFSADWRDELFEYHASPKEARAHERAERRGLKLLKEWLSPAQRAQYQREKCFEVIGGQSGTRYRIRHGTQMNIEQLDGLGKRVCGWCFLPAGGLVAGDVMLAQKIALETDDRAALKIANRIASMTDYPSVSPYARAENGFISMVDRST